MYLSKLLYLSRVLLIFPRALTGLRAAHLNQQMVVTGGQHGSKDRDEVLCGIILLIMRNLSCFKVLQYNNEERTWLKIGRLERERSYHAIVEVNLDAICSAVGNLNPIK